MKRAVISLSGLSLVFGLLGGCASHKDFIDVGSCKAWSEDKFKVPFVPLLPRFKIPSKAELDLACREGHAIAKPVGIQGGTNAAANLLSYKAYTIARQKVTAGENPDYYTAVLSFADYFLREQGRSYGSLTAAFTQNLRLLPHPHQAMWCRIIHQRQSRCPYAPEQVLNGNVIVPVYLQLPHLRRHPALPFKSARRVLVPSAIKAA
jgi:hypothetical protein